VCNKSVQSAFQNHYKVQYNLLLSLRRLSSRPTLYPSCLSRLCCVVMPPNSLVLPQPSSTPYKHLRGCIYSSSSASMYLCLMSFHWRCFPRSALLSRMMRERPDVRRGLWSPR
jgi:hypothetical protein